MKLNIDNKRSQGDPYVIKSGEKYYMYATHSDGVQLYDSTDRINWRFRGFCFTRLDEKEYWAPAVLEYQNKFWLYYSSMPMDETDTHTERICVAVCDAPDGMFRYAGELTSPFSIDPHVVVSGGELYMFYSINDYDAVRAGTLIVVDKMKSPCEMCGNPAVAVRATLDQEIFMRNRFKEGQDWHTIEGAFYFRSGDYHYITYSGNCYQNENYYIGYAVAEGSTDDLTSLKFRKYPDDDTYLPLVCKNDTEEGTGHNSILSDGGKYYLFYHGRDYGSTGTGSDRRTARVCQIEARNGELEVVKR